MIAASVTATVCLNPEQLWKYINTAFYLQIRWSISQPGRLFSFITQMYRCPVESFSCLLWYGSKHKLTAVRILHFLAVCWSLQQCVFVFLVFKTWLNKQKPKFPVGVDINLSKYFIRATMESNLSELCLTTSLPFCVPSRLWVRSWRRLGTTPRKRRTTCYMPRTSERAETSTKPYGRSARATPSSV